MAKPQSATEVSQCASREALCLLAVSVMLRGFDSRWCSALPTSRIAASRDEFAAGDRQSADRLDDFPQDLRDAKRGAEMILRRVPGLHAILILPLASPPQTGRGNADTHG